MPGEQPPGAVNTNGAPAGGMDLSAGSHFQRSAVFDEVDWSWVVSGEREHDGAVTTLLLPPAPGFAALLGELISAMPAGMRVIAPTYPAVPDSGALVEGLASMCRTERVQRVNLVGFGIGGVLAQMFAKRASGVVNKVALVNTTTPEQWASGPERARYNASRFVPAWVLRRIVAGRFVSRGAFSGDERARWKRLLRECLAQRADRWEVLSLSAAGFDAQRVALERGGWALERFEGRIQIIESVNDHHLTPAQRSALKSAYPTAHVRKVPDAGRLLGCEDAARLVGLLETFLNEVDIIDRTPGGGR